MGLLNQNFNNYGVKNMADSDWASSHEHKDWEFELECPNCKKTNLVIIYKQDGHLNIKESCYCASCHHKLGEYIATFIETKIK